MHLGQWPLIESPTGGVGLEGDVSAGSLSRLRKKKIIFSYKRGKNGSFTLTLFSGTWCQTCKDWKHLWRIRTVWCRFAARVIVSGCTLKQRWTGTWFVAESCLLAWTQIYLQWNWWKIWILLSLVLIHNQMTNVSRDSGSGATSSGGPSLTTYLSYLCSTVLTLWPPQALMRLYDLHEVIKCTFQLFSQENHFQSPDNSVITCCYGSNYEHQSNLKV